MEFTTATWVLTSSGQWNPMDVFWKCQDPSSILVQASCVCVCLYVYLGVLYTSFTAMYGIIWVCPACWGNWFQTKVFLKMLFWYQIKSQQPQPTCCMSLCLPLFTYMSHTTVVLMYPFWTPCRDRWFHCSSGLAASSSSLVVGSLKETRHDYRKHGWKFYIMTSTDHVLLVVHGQISSEAVPFSKCSWNSDIICSCGFLSELPFRSFVVYPRAQQPSHGTVFWVVCISVCIHMIACISTNTIEDIDTMH